MANVIRYEEIKAILPHRYPFLMVDRVTDYNVNDDPAWMTGYKNLSSDALFFEGHFPSRAMMPGVLQLEAMAQLGGILVFKKMNLELNCGIIPVLGGVDESKFKRTVYPGDRMDMEIKLTRIRGNFGIAECKSTVEGELASSAIIKFVLVDPKKEG